MELDLNRKSETPLYLQISNSIKCKFYENEIFEGYQLPSERALAQQLNVHRNTVIKAYEELIFQGLVIASRQSPRGYFIYRQKYTPKAGSHFFPLEQSIKYQVDAYSTLFGDIYEESASQDYISFGGMIVSEATFPKEMVKNILSQAIQENETGLYEYCSPKGSEALRDVLVKTLAKRNMQITPRNIQIISETLQGIGYITKLYLRAGDTIIAEEPIVPEVVNLFLNAGVKVVTIPMEDDGMNMKILEEAIEKHSPKFIYTLPNYHIPTGILTSFEKRKKLLEYAYKYNIPIIEEDSQREIYYNEKSIPTLYAMDERGQVVYIDSFAFTFFLGALIGYVVEPLDVVDTICKIIRMEQILVSGVSQYLTYKFLESGGFETHTKYIREYYKHKRDLICIELEQLKPLGVEFTKPEGGLLLWLKLPKDISERRLFQSMKEKKVLIIPGFLFFPNGNSGDGFIRLCFSNVAENQIKEGIKILGKVIEEIREN